ncbi:hypothetical protein TWF481_012139 [Arthrobotrys musiformis]|uniref:Uncharacterized protein n=1 Tax=Arthrobotrys musiformis TaxID=47236 RepID=A0AAV9VXL4_9PEZI
MSPTPPKKMLLSIFYTHPPTTKAVTACVNPSSITIAPPRKPRPRKQSTPSFDENDPIPDISDYESWSDSEKRSFWELAAKAAREAATTLSVPLSDGRVLTYRGSAREVEGLRERIGDVLQDEGHPDVLRWRWLEEECKRWGEVAKKDGFAHLWPEEWD